MPPPSGQGPIGRGQRKTLGSGNSEVQRVQRPQGRGELCHPVAGKSIVASFDRQSRIEIALKVSQELRDYTPAVRLSQVAPANLPGDRRQEFDFRQVANPGTRPGPHKLLGMGTQRLRAVVGDEDACIQVDQYRSSARARTTDVLMGAPRSTMERRKAPRLGRRRRRPFGGTMRATSLPLRSRATSSPVATSSNSERSCCLASATLTLRNVNPPLGVICTGRLYTCACVGGSWPVALRRRRSPGSPCIRMGAGGRRR
jgi:hypothetical protein